MSPDTGHSQKKNGEKEGNLLIWESPSRYRKAFPWYFTQIVSQVNVKNNHMVNNFPKYVFHKGMFSQSRKTFQQAREMFSLPENFADKIANSYLWDKTT